MRAVSSTYKSIIASGETRKYVVRINLNLADNTALTITDADIMENSFKILTASSGQSSLDIGSAIIGMCQFTLDNFTDRWTQYDFFDATATVWIGLVGDTENNTQVYHRIGFFTVDEPNIVGSLISLELLDNMWMFDRDLPNIYLPQTVGTIVNTLCTHCGVTLASQIFNGSDYWVQYLPPDDMNCRELLQYLVMIGCNFCVMDGQGALKIRWYDTASRPSDNLDGGTFSTSTTPYSDGDTADGGNFSNYTAGADYDGGTFTDNPNVAYFTRLFDRKIGTDSITVTGVKIKIGEQDYLMGTEGYVLVIENPLVTEDNVSAILSRIWNRLQGFTFRTYDVTTLPDLAPEVGDCVGVSYKGTIVYSYLTNNTFTPSLTTASLGAVTPTRALSQRYSKAVQTAVDVARQRVDQRIGIYDLTAQRMNQLAMNALGCYTDYDDMPTGGRVYYLSNAPITKNATTGMCEFPYSATVYKTTGDGFFISTPDDVHPETHVRSWRQGYSPSQGLVVDLLNALRINAEQLVTGQLTIGGSVINVEHPHAVILDENNHPICFLDYRGITMYQGLIQSPDYAEETPVGTYAASGMAIDVNNATLKSEYFAINALGAFLKGTIEAIGGHIGAAVITQDAITIRGDIELYKGSGTFQFRPTDYYLAEDFNLLFKTGEGDSSTVTLKLHQNSLDTILDTYSVDDEGVESSLLNHLIGLNADDYYEIIVSGDSTTVLVEDAILARMGLNGFEGTLRGIFKGYLESDSGKIAGLKYDWGSNFYGSNVTLVNEGKKLIFDNPSNAIPDIKRTYTENGSTVTDSVVWESDFGHYQSFIDQDAVAPQSGGTEGDLVFVGTDGTSKKELYRRDSSGWTKVEMGAEIDGDITVSTPTTPLRHITISTYDIGEGANLDADTLYLVVDP